MYKNYNRSNSPRHHIILFLLCTFLIYMVLGSGDHSFVNAEFIFNLEVIFTSMYILFFLKEVANPIQDIKKYKSTIILLALWACSVTYSYLSSTYYIDPSSPVFSSIYETKYPYARYRLSQTFMHIMFFIAIWHYLKNSSINLNYIFYTITISTILVAIYFFYHWFNNTWHDFGRTSNDPPLNSHVRHTGYQVEAALSFFFIFLIRNCKKNDITFSHIFGYIFLWGFLFWLGGRGAILATFTSFIVIVLILKYKEINYRNIVIITIPSIFIGMFLSEFLSVYPWNGVLELFQRSISSESFNQLSAGRMVIWATVIESLSGNVFFGLGPQGFYLMENSIKGFVQPHNFILQFLIEWGVVGTFLFLLLLLKATWAGIKLHVLNKDRIFSPSALAAGAVICTLSVNALTDGTYYHPQPSVYLALAFAIWVLPPKRKTMTS